MIFNIMTKCTSCNEEKMCNETCVEFNGEKKIMNFCKECDEKITEITVWADNFNLKYKNEVECPYCYAIYDINETGTSFACSGCESLLDVESDEDGNPYIESC